MSASLIQVLGHRGHRNPRRWCTVFSRRLGPMFYSECLLFGSRAWRLVVKKALAHGKPGDDGSAGVNGTAMGAPA